MIYYFWNVRFRWNQIQKSSHGCYTIQHTFIHVLTIIELVDEKSNNTRILISDFVYLQYQELEHHFQLVPLRFARLPNIYQFPLVWLEGVKENYMLYSHRISPLWWVSKIFVNPPRCIVHQYWQNWSLYRFEMVLNRKGAYGLHKDWHSVFEDCSRPPPFW